MITETLLDLQEKIKQDELQEQFKTTEENLENLANAINEIYEKVFLIEKRLKKLESEQEIIDEV
jgi:hypothetical protein